MRASKAPRAQLASVGEQTDAVGLHLILPLQWQRS